MAKDGFSKRLVAKIIDNLQIKITNVHIRYEIPEAGVACGFSVSSLSALSTDENWVPAFVDTKTVLHKAVDLKALTIYVDPNAKPVNTGASFADAMRQMIATAPGPGQVLQPVSASLRLIINKVSRPDVPMVKANLNIERVSLSLERVQYQHVLSLSHDVRAAMVVKAIAHVTASDRPRVPVHGHAAAWWKFARGCVFKMVAEQRKTWKAPVLLREWHESKKYMAAYKQFAIAYVSDHQKGGKAEAALKIQQDNLRGREDVFSFERVIALRAAVDRQIAVEKLEAAKKKAAQPPPKKSLFGYFSRSGEEDRAALTETQRQQLLDLVNDTESEMSDAEAEKAEFVQVSAIISLTSGTFALYDSHADRGVHCLTSCRFDGASLSVVRRVGGNLQVGLRLASFELCNSASPNSLFPLLVSCETTAGGSKKPLLSVDVDVQPLDGHCDTQVILALRSMDIVYDASWLAALMAFFQPKSDVESASLDSLESVALEQLGAARQSLSAAVENHSKLDLQLTIAAPTIILPSTCLPAEGNTTVPALVFHLGSLSVTSNLAPTPEDEETLVSGLTEAELYDRYELSATELRALVCTFSAKQKQAVAHNLDWRISHSASPLCQDLSIGVTVSVSIVPNSIKITKTKVTANIPAISILLSSLQVQTACQVVKALTASFPTRSTTTPAVGAADTAPVTSLVPHDFGAALGDGVDVDMLVAWNKLSLSFSLGEVSVRLFDDRVQSRSLLTLTMTSLDAQLALKSFSTTLELSVQAIDAVDHLQTCGIDFAALLSTGSQLGSTPRRRSVDGDSARRRPPVLALSLVQTSRRSPRYQAPDLLLVANVHELALGVNFDTLVAVMDVGKACVAPLLVQEAPAVPQRRRSSVSRVATTKLPPKTTALPTLRATMAVNFAAVSLYQCVGSSGTELARVEVSSVEGTVTRDSVGVMDVCAALGALSLTHLPGSSQQMDLVAATQKASPTSPKALVSLALQVVPPQLAAKRGYDLKVALSIQSARVTVVAGPLLRILSCLTDNALVQSNKDALAEAAAAASDRVKETAVDSSAKRVKLDVDLSHPMVTISRHAEPVLNKDGTLGPMDFLIADLGHLNISNSFKTAAVGTCTVDAIAVVLKDVRLACDPDVRVAVEQHVAGTKPVSTNDMLTASITLNVRRTLDDKEERLDVPALALEAAVTQFTLMSNPSQFHYLYSTVMSVSNAFAGGLSGSSETDMDEERAVVVDNDPSREFKDHGPVKTSASVVVESISVLLSDDDDVPIVSMRTVGLQASFLQSKGDAMDVSLRLSSVDLRDASPSASTRAFTQVIQLADSGSASALPMVDITAQRFPGNHAQANVAMRAFRFYLLPSVVVPLKAFAPPPASAPQARRGVRGAVEDKAARSDVAESGSLALELQIPVCEVIAIEDVERADCRQLSFQFQLAAQVGKDMVSQGQTLTLTAQDLCVAMTSSDAERRPILNPFSVSVCVNLGKNTAVGVANGKIMVSDLVGVLSYTQLKFMNALRLAFVPPTSGDASETVSRVEMPQNVVERAADDSNRDAQYSISIGRVMLVVDNDCRSFNSPFLQLSLPHLECSARVQPSGYVIAEVNTEIRADFFNAHRMIYEPLIEPWNVGIKVNKAGDRSHISIEAAHLDLNLSATHVVTAVATLSTWAADFGAVDEASDDSTKSHAPYAFVNNTGIALVFWRTWEDAGSVAGRKVEDGISAPFSVTQPGTRVVASVIASESTLIRVQSLSDPSLSFSIAVDKLGTEVYTAGAHAVLVSVAVEGCCKIVTVRSAAVFRNDTCSPLVISLKAKGSEVWSTNVNTASTVACPFIAHDHLNIRPNNSESFVWSNALERAHVEKSDHSDYLLTSQSASKAMFCCRVHVTTERVAGGPPYVLYTFIAPLRIQNLLPVPLTVCVFEDGSKEADVHTLSAASAAPIHVFGLGKCLKLSCEIDGFRKTKYPVLIHSTQKDGKRATTVHMKDTSDRLLVLCIDYWVDPNTEEQIVGIFCPYWFVNRTSVPLWYLHGGSFGAALCAASVDSPVVEAPFNDELSSTEWYTAPASPFLYSYPSIEKKFDPFSNTTRVQLAGSGKPGSAPSSKEFSTDAVGTVGVLQVPGGGQPPTQFGLTFEMATGHFSRTKVVSFFPRFVLVNNLDVAVDVLVTAADKKQDMTITLSPNQTRPLLTCANDAKMCVRPISGYSWSGNFAFDSVCNFPIRMRATGAAEDERWHVSIVSAKASVLVSISQEDPSAPFYRIVNDTGVAVSYWQKRQQQQERLAPGEARAYAFDQPTDSHVLVTRFEGAAVDVEVDMDLLQLRSEPTLVKVGAATTPLVATLETHAKTRTLTFTTSNSDVRTPSDAGSGELVSSLSLSLAGVGVSVIDASPAEVLYVSVTGVSVSMETTTTEQTTEVKVMGLQIDNQSGMGLPVMLGCIREEDEEPKPVLHLSRCLTFDGAVDVDHFTYVSAGIQALQFTTDENMLLRLLSLVKELSPSTGEDISDQAEEQIRKDISCVQTQALEVALATQASRMTYIELLELHPLKVIVTFAGTGLWIERAENQAKGRYQALFVLAKGFGAALTNIDHAPLTLNALILERAFGSAASLRDNIVHHYSLQVVKQAYALLGSFELLGNPVGLVSSFGTGVFDFFYEPAQGLVRSPKDFGKGLAKGTLSLAKNSIHGTFNTISKITGSVGKGLRSLSMDDEYAKQQASAERPKHAGDGLLMGVEGLGRGIFDGVTGIVTRPVDGAKKDGVSGFFKGMAKGVVGVAVKPVAGVLDLASKTTEGIKNTVSTTVPLTRVRPPRYISPLGLQPYSCEISEVWSLLPPPLRSQPLLHAIDMGDRKHRMCVLEQCVLLMKPASKEIMWQAVRADITEVKAAGTKLSIACVRKGSAKPKDESFSLGGMFGGNKKESAGASNDISMACGDSRIATKIAAILNGK